MRHSKNFKDIAGQKFNRLTVIKFAYRGKDNRAYWECKCDCGNVVIVSGKNLRSGSTKSCGCYNLESISKRNKIIHRIHGGTNTKLFRIWSGIKTRCNNCHNSNYRYYGAKGIRICPDWENSYETFREWALSSGYEDGLSIDRIDFNGNYEPSNCRWVAGSVQQRNRSSNRIITYNGESHCLSEWAEILGIDSDVLLKRLGSKNFSLEEAFTLPVRVHDHRNEIIKFNGESKTLLEWANSLSIPYNALRSRLYSQHWDVERAFKTKYVPKRRSQ